MALQRKYSVSEIKEFVELFRHDADTMPEKIQGMTDLVTILAHFEYMTDTQIEREAIEAYRRLKL